ncbi:hypothetical protein ACDN41_12525 [Priestia aryabhattai]|uniref:hypothetical protein n=1 Tax=Priestia aryabhattai TaxID=412384 RepID=UPI003531B205
MFIYEVEHGNGESTILYHSKEYDQDEFQELIEKTKEIFKYERMEGMNVTNWIIDHLVSEYDFKKIISGWI